MYEIKTNQHSFETDSSADLIFSLQTSFTCKSCRISCLSPKEKKKDRGFQMNWYELVQASPRALVYKSYKNSIRYEQYLSMAQIDSIGEQLRSCDKVTIALP